MTSIGVTVHPTRDVGGPLETLRVWASGHGARIVQVGGGSQPEVAPAGDAAGCELVVTIGGDGTALAGLRAAAPAGRPLLGVACGSLGALTTVSAAGLGDALDRFSAGDWHRVSRPALVVRRGDEELLAYNDLALVRAGEGQLRTRVELDGVLYGRLAGDGLIVSTPVGSSAYTLAAGGPLLAPGTAAFVFTPLPTHGGAIPPLVVPGDSSLRLEVSAAVNGARLEIDGRQVGDHEGALEVSLRGEAAILVGLQAGDPLITGLRERGVIADSPRILAEDARNR
jgi:NAD+ kinase